MTFTEAAVQVLRLVGRPLHYRKITEIAIAKNLLSHVGKSPDMTMSSRLATMVKKDRGGEPIVKLKPGVFALREFSEEALALADTDFDLDLDALPPLPEPEPRGEAGGAAAAAPAQDVFPVEEDDDEPILANLDAGAPEEPEEGQGRRRRRRRGRGRGRDGDDGAKGARRGSERDGNNRREARREPRRGRGRGRERERLDMDQPPEDGASVGGDLADAAYAILRDGPRETITATRLAELLVERGRLSGAPASLAPTVAAAIRADRLRLGALGSRFRTVDGELALQDWYLPKEAARAQQDARKAASRLRELVHRAFLKKLADLPAAGFAELIATWLNAEGIGGLRAVRRPTSSGNELHLAGVRRRGQEEVRVAILVMRGRRELAADRIVEIRGALHHYGNASEAWVVTTGRLAEACRAELGAAGVPPCTAFDGDALAAAMEQRGVGLRAVTLPVCALDLELLDAMRGSAESLGGGRRRERDAEREPDEEEGEGRGRRRRKRRRDRDGEEGAPEAAADAAGDEGPEERAEAEGPPEAGSEDAPAGGDADGAAGDAGADGDPEGAGGAAGDGDEGADVGAEDAGADGDAGDGSEEDDAGCPGADDAGSEGGEDPDDD